jgi:hypothetical protein
VHAAARTRKTTGAKSVEPLKKQIGHAADVARLNGALAFARFFAGRRYDRMLGLLKASPNIVSCSGDYKGASRPHRKGPRMSSFIGTLRSCGRNGQTNVVRRDIKEPWNA